MCQVYESERASIVRGENQATIAGFVAALKNLPKSKNPHDSFREYDRKAWDHGWNCWQIKILPWALAQILRKDGKFSEAQEAERRFALDREIPLEIEPYLRD